MVQSSAASNVRVRPDSVDVVVMGGCNESQMDSNWVYDGVERFATSRHPHGITIDNQEKQGSVCIMLVLIVSF